MCGCDWVNEEEKVGGTKLAITKDSVLYPELFKKRRVLIA
jgi:hypothetical protein